MKDWKDSRPTDFMESIKFLDYCYNHAIDSHWSIQYYGYGEHLTYWSGFTPQSYGFADFGVDQGTAINWKLMKEIIIESAQCLWDAIKQDKPHVLSIDKDVEEFMKK